MKTEQGRSLRTILDRRLAGVGFNKKEQTLEKLRQMQASRPQPKPRLVLAFALLLVLLAGIALAFSLNYSPAYQARQRAGLALAEKYGLDQQSLSLFYDDARRTSVGWDIHFINLGRFSAQSGSYRVILDGQEARASWSHDGVDKSVYQDGSLSAPVWGQAQLLAFIKQGRKLAELNAQIDWEHMDQMSLKERARESERLLALEPPGGSGLPIHLVPSQDDLSPKEAIALAGAEIMRRYGVDGDFLGQHQMTLSFFQFSKEEGRRYSIQWSRTNEAGAVNQFLVELSSPGGQMLQVHWSADREACFLPEGPLDAYREMVQEYIASGAFAGLDATDKGRLAQRIAKAGHGDLLPKLRYALPGPGLLDEASARAALYKDLEEAFALDAAGRGLFDQDISLLQEGSRLVWQLDLRFERRRDTHFPAQMPLGEYRARVDARDGSSLGASWSLSGQNKGQAYTEASFGQALALEGYMLPWLIQLMEDIKPYYQADEHFLGLLDAALHDKRMREAGYPLAIYAHSLPDPKAQDMEKARALAISGLQAEFGVSDQTIKDSFVYAEYLMDSSHHKNPNDRDIWTFTFHHFEGIYHAALDAFDGTILILLFDPAASGNG